MNEYVKWKISWFGTITYNFKQDTCAGKLNQGFNE